MKKITLAASLIIAPALAHAQAGAHVQSQASVSATTAGSPPVGRSASGAASASAATQASGSVSGSRATSATAGDRHLSSSAQGKIDADLQTARERKLPEEPIRERVAEGRAKGATDAQIAAASGRALLDLEGAFDAMVRGGRTSPTNSEVTRGASLIARGYTTVQLEGLARNAGPERSLSTAFEVLASLQARGVSTTNALAEVGSELSARASDAQLGALAANAGTSNAVMGTLGSGQGSLAGAVTGNAGAGVAGSAAAGGPLSGATSGASAAGGVSGAVTGVIGKP